MSFDAVEATIDAQEEINAYKSILEDCLYVDHQIDLIELIDNRVYRGTPPVREQYYQNKGLAKLLMIIPKIKNTLRQAESSAEIKYKQAVQEHIKNRKAFYENQEIYNLRLKQKKTAYEVMQKDGVEFYINQVLRLSEYPSSLKLNYSLYYEPESELMIVDIILPNTKQVPKIIEYKYIKSRNEIVTKEMKAKEFEEFYNDCLYQIALRTIYEVFDSDYVNAIDIVVVNGIVHDISPSTGAEVSQYVLSVQAQREEFESIDLSRVKASECFKHLKGLTAGSFTKMQPVTPIIQFDEDDQRIVKADAIIDSLDTGKNLATMDWLEFEILVRDLLQMEFGNNNCSVEVTRASRDAGVDAIMFDRDPIRGGKYIIQAKRYNNIVPVSAVRDLYGAVVDEGAAKGILVTTSYYGPDSLEFAKDKPLSLINGQHLLNMFHKHGVNVKIELQKKS